MQATQEGISLVNCLSLQPRGFISSGTSVPNSWQAALNQYPIQFAIFTLNSVITALSQADDLVDAVKDLLSNLGISLRQALC